MNGTVTSTNSIERAKRPGLLAIGAVTAGALAAVAVASVPTAGASCVSFFGLGGSGGQCTSTLTSIAIAIGENAEAHADGLLGAALTLGNSSSALINAGAVANLAVTLGNSNITSAGGLGSLAFAGRSTVNQLVQAGIGGVTSGNIGNFAASIASPEATQTLAMGIGNLSLNLAGSGYIGGDGVGLTTVNLVGLGTELSNGGVLNAIANVSGDNNKITNTLGTGGIANLAFNFIGNDNLISTGKTLAVAGAIGSTGQTVEQEGLGVNISFGRRTAAPTAAKAVTAPVAAVGVAKSEKKPTPARAARASRSSR